MKNLIPDTHNPGALRPFARQRLDSDLPGRVLLATADFTLSVDDLDLTVTSGDGRALLAATLDVAPDCAVESGDDIVLLTAEGPRYIATASWTYLGPMPQLPAVTIEAVDDAPIAVNVEPVELQGVYPHDTGRLCRADRRAIADALMSAYTAARASTTGFLQPALVAYRVIDRHGNVIHRSAPKLLGAPQLATPFVAPRSAGVVGPMSMTLRPWSIRVSVDGTLPAPWAERIDRIEILASDELSLFDIDMLAEGRVTSASAVTVAMPGVPDSPEAAIARCRAIVAGLLERRDRAMHNARCIMPNAQLNVYTFKRLNGNTSSFANQRSILNAKPYTENALVARLSAPHRFTATSAARAGDTVAYANPRALRYAGLSIGELTATTLPAAGRWRVAVSVEMADGVERVVRAGSFDGPYPAALSPLICYPSADARRLTIVVADPQGAVKRAVLELTPSSHSDIAYWIHSRLEPWLPGDEIDIFAVPAERRVERRYDGFVLAATAAAPLTPLSSVAVMPAPIVKVVAAMRSASSWDFGRAHFYAMGPRGIYSVGVSRGSILQGASPVDRRGVGSPLLVTDGDTAAYVVAGRQLLEVSGQRTRLLLRDIEADRVGYTSTLGGIVWLSLGDTLRALHLPSSTLVDVEPAEADGSIPINFLSTAPVAAGDEGYVMAEVPVSGSALDLEALVVALDNPLRGLARLRVSGTVRRPVRRALPVPPRRRYALRVDGRVSPDTIVSLPPKSIL